jgi:hypothetical protein
MTKAARMLGSRRSGEVYLCRHEGRVTGAEVVVPEREL